MVNKMIQTCPNCHRKYKTVLDREHPEICIQKEHPNTKAFEREQLITGLCSDECWNEYIGGNDE